MRAFRTHGEPSVCVQRADEHGDASRGPVVLFVHGTTFPTALASGYRFDDGTSWIGATAAEGFDVWAVDFAGYGRSDRYPEMSGEPYAAAPLGRAPAAAAQIASAAEHISRERGVEGLSIVAHSWGTIVAARYASSHPHSVQRLVLFGPIARREVAPDVPALPAFRDVTVAEQHSRFIEDVPDGREPVLEDFDRWGREYLATDSDAEARDPPAVRIPGGPPADIAASWAGYFPYDPASIGAAVLIVRGAWDSLCQDDDARWLRTRMTSAAEVREAVVERATHLMHLERGRFELYAAVNEFLSG